MKPTVDSLTTFCVVLPEWVDRAAQADKHFKNIGLPVQFIQGVYAQGFGISTATHYPEAEGGHLIPQASVGMFLSMYTAWTVAYHSAGEHFMFLEDDAEFVSNWRERLNQALSDVPEGFDFLYVGSCNTEGKPANNIAGEVWKIEWPHCLHAYIVSKKGLGELLYRHRKIRSNLDLEIAASLSEMNAFTILPRIAGQRNTTLAP